MSKNVVLMVSADPAQLHAWETEIARARHLPIPAATIREAQQVLRQVHADVVLSGDLPDGCTDALCGIVRQSEARPTPLIVCARLSEGEYHRVASDPATLVVPPEERGAPLGGAPLDQVLGAEMPRAPRL